MIAWIDAEMQAPDAQLHTTLVKFTARLSGRLREWWIDLGEYQQWQVLQATSIDSFVLILHNEFLSAITHQTAIAREEYLSMKCCSYKHKDLEWHYNNMSKRFYLLGGMDDLNLKQAFLNSLLELLGNKTHKLLEIKGIGLQNESLSEIYQNTSWH